MSGCFHHLPADPGFTKEALSKKGLPAGQTEVTLFLLIFSSQVIEYTGIQLAAHTAVYDQLGAGDVLRLVTAQEPSSVGDVLKIRNVTNGRQLTVRALRACRRKR